MKELILAALTAKFEGVSVAILGRIADKLAKTVTKEDDVATAVGGVTFQKVLEAYGDSRATEAQQTAVKNYEQKYSLKDGKPQQQQSQQTETENQEETPAWVKKLVDANKALAERLDAMEGERLSTARRAKLAEITKALPETMRKAYGRTPVDKLTDEEFESLISEITSEVEGIVKENSQRGAVFGRPSANGGQGDHPEKLTEEQEKAISQRGSAVQEGQYF